MNRFYDYDISITSDDDTLNTSYTVSYKIPVEVQDIIEYYFEQHYKVKYHPLAWIVEDNALQFVKNIEEQYFSNKIKEFDLYVQDRDFIQFIRNKYVEEMLQKELYNIIDYFRNNSTLEHISFKIECNEFNKSIEDSLFI